MTIPILQQSQYNGEIFVSNYHAVHDLLQLARLDPDHSFRQLWHSHLRSLTQTGGLFEGVIDCLAAILLSDPCWKETTPTAVSQTRSDVCSLLTRTPPNIIILSSLDTYACHVRCSALWNFICISKDFVMLWIEAIKPKRKNGLRALLITSIDHEIAHWAQSIRNGICYLPPSSRVSDLTTIYDLDSDSSDDEDCASSTVSPVKEAEVSPEFGLSPGGTAEVTSSIVSPVNEGEVSPFHDSGTNKNMTTVLADTLKAFQAPWMSDPIGEAGEFLEISTRGGIMEYHPVRRQVYFMVGEDDHYFAEQSYLDLYEQDKGSSASLFFRPASWKSSTSPGVKTKDANARFPFGGVDGCPSSRRSCQQNHHNVPGATKVLKF